MIELPAPLVTTLANGVAVLAWPLAHLASAAVGVYVRWGSAHESRALSGIGHVLEHMAFKGTATRDARRINLDAERLGAEVNAHTDKDHTAYHMVGQAAHAPRFVHMLADIVRHATLPEAELERERQVLLHEFTEDEDDPLATAFKLFDRACFGLHPAAQPVIGTRANIERFTREDLLGHLAQGYTGCNLLVGAVGAVDPDAVQRAAEAAFGDMPHGTPNRVADAPYIGGLRTKGQPGSSQTHLVLGYPLPSMRAADPGGALAAAVLGEGMSSPLLDALREQRGLAYYAACSADVLEMCGQFVIEASTGPDSLDELLQHTLMLLARHADAVDPLDLDRARQQLLVRALRARERPLRLLEDAALDWFALGRVRSEQERAAALDAVGTAELRAVFERMGSHPLSLAVGGKVARGTRERLERVLHRTLPSQSAGADLRRAVR
jgi:predicted Zn-dependent peptidase